MTAVRTLSRPMPAAPPPARAPGPITMAVSAVVRAAVTAASGLVLVVGLALLLWAVTPASGASPVPVLRGGVAAYAAGNLMPVAIGESVLTLPPLLLTFLFAGLLGAGVVRGRVIPEGLVAEAAAAVLAAAAYTGVAVAASVRLGPPGAVRLEDAWRVGALALTATVVGTLLRGRAWRTRWADRAPGWVQVAVRCGTAAVAVVGVGAVALLAALAVSFGDATDLAGIAAPTAGDGFGLALLGLAFLPNAVVVAAGYATGVGFEIGSGTYSPLLTHGTELPAVPMLAAVPASGGVSYGIGLVAGPLLVGALIGWAITRRLATRMDRMLAAVGSAVWAAGLLAGLAAVATGGVSGSAWGTIGVPVGLFAAAVAVEVGLPALTWTAVAGWSAVPWRLRPEGTAEDDQDAEDLQDAANDEDDANDDGSEAGADEPDRPADDDTDAAATDRDPAPEDGTAGTGEAAAAPASTEVAAEHVRTPVPSRTLDPGRAWLYRRFSVAARAYVASGSGHGVDQGVDRGVGPDADGHDGAGDPSD